MAVFESSRLYHLVLQAEDFPNNFTPSLVAETVSNATNGGAGDTSFEPGQTIHVVRESFENDFTYVGHYGDGWVGQIELEGQTYLFLFTNDELSMSDTVTPESSAFAICFLEGTHIATPEGERTVEDLAVGDLVLTADGSVREVRWIGRQSVVAVFASPLRDYPIRVSAGALADGVPVRDLFVSPGHALFIDGLLVQAGALVNGSSITRATHPAPRFTWYHIETEDHAIILAEGTPAETFVDNVTRRRFDNHAEFEALYGTPEALIQELDMPRLRSARQLPAALRERLAARAAALGLGLGAAA